MGRRGPKPRSREELHKIDSKWARFAYDHPEGPPLADNPPEWMGEHGKKEWLRIVASAEAAKMVTSWDYALLVGYCDAWHEFVLAVLKIGDELEREGKQSDVHPLLKVKDAAWKRVNSCAKELGFTPASRARIDIVNHGEETETKDEQARFFKLG